MPRLKMNLQLFNEGTEAPATEAPVTDTHTDVTVSEGETGNVEAQEGSEGNAEQAQPSLLDQFEYQYNKESVKPQSLEELKELAEMGRYYKEKGKTQLESYKNDPRIGLVERLASENNMDVDQYLEAVEKQREYDKIQAIAQEKNVPVEVANELYEGIKLKEQQAREAQSIQAERASKEDLNKFVEMYPDVKELPDEVLKAWTPGTKLTEIYKDYEYNQMKSKIEEMESKLKTHNQNIENSEASTGSVTGNGDVNDKLFTRAEVKKMSREQVKKNYSKIIQSQKAWK